MDCEMHAIIMIIISYFAGCIVTVIILWKFNKLDKSENTDGNNG